MFAFETYAWLHYTSKAHDIENGCNVTVDLYTAHYVVPQVSVAQEVSIELSNFRISSINSEVRSMLLSTINTEHHWEVLHWITRGFLQIESHF